MYVNPELRQMSQVLTVEQMQEINADAIEIHSHNLQRLEELRKQLREIGYKEVEVD